MSPARAPDIPGASHGRASNLEGFSEGQPGHHPGAGVSRHRVERHDRVQPAPRGVPDPHPAEEVVSVVRARGDQRRGGQGLRVREGPVGGGGRRGHRQGEDRVHQGDQPAAVRRRRRDRPDVRRQGLLPGARGADGGRRLRGDARRHDRQGRHRQGGDPRPRVPGGGEAAQAGPGDVHAAPRRRDPHHRPDRRAARRARQGLGRRGQARPAGDRQLSGSARISSPTPTNTRAACAQSSTPRWPARKSSRRRKRPRRRSST